jgi:hypothetical protein
MSSKTKHTTTQPSGTRRCVHDSHFLSPLIYYQLNSCLRSSYLDYQPESFKDSLLLHTLVCSKRPASLCNIRHRNATFLIQAKAAADGPASFTGQIFDDKSRPLAGIKVSLGRTAMVSTTDEQGQFELNNIPPGRIDLFIDGRTYNPSFNPARAQYPSLHFEAYAVKGRVNQIAHPIYLPPLATSSDSAKVVGGSTDVILTIPGLAGFQMKIKANSVTFPDGSKTGLLIVSPVTADKLPMSPPAGGATFGVPAWTIQPAGTRFDPPIEVTLPNAGGYPAGDNLPIVQWDHDLGQYVAMGRATVSEDGAVLITDSSSGLTKAGWGGLCQYDPNKCGKSEPPDCSKYLCRSLVASSDGCSGTCEKDSSKKGNKGVEISGGLGPYTWNIASRPQIPLFKAPRITIFGSVQGQLETQKECCLGLEEEGRRVSLKATVEIGQEGELAFSRYPLVAAVKLSVAGSIALETDACQLKPPIVGELEAIGEARTTLGEQVDDFRVNLLSTTAVAKGKTQWTKENRDLVVNGTFELEGTVNALQFNVFGINTTGFTWRWNTYKSPSVEIYRRVGLFE